MSLQFGVSVEPQLVGEPDDGRTAGSYPVGQLRHGAKGQQRGLGQHHLGDAAFCRSQPVTDGGDEVGGRRSGHAGQKVT